MPGPASFRGRGLAISEALTRSLTIKSEQGWIVVTALLDLSAVAMAPPAASNAPAWGTGTGTATASLLRRTENDD